jgi:hypothetical protein
LYICVLLIIKTKNKKVMDKVRKNLLGRNVTIKKEAKSDGSLAKTRTVTSKSGGTISSKTSYKDGTTTKKNLLGRTVEKKASPYLSHNHPEVGMIKSKAVFRKDGTMARYKSSDIFPESKTVVTKRKGTKVDPKTNTRTIKTKTVVRKRS